MQRVNTLVEQSEQRMYQHLLDSNNSWAATTQEVRDAQRKMQALQEVVLHPGWRRRTISGRQ